jgi:hypothetical protein
MKLIWNLQVKLAIGDCWRSLIKDDRQSIESVSGNETTSESHSYSFKDNIDLALNHNLTLYYRLKQIDFEGSFTYSNKVEVDLTLPRAFTLEQYFQNPFNPSTTIKYNILHVALSLAEGSRVVLKVYYILGNEVATIVNEE